MQFDHGKNKILIVNFGPSHTLGLYKGSEVTVGSEDTFQFFKGILEHLCSISYIWWPYIDEFLSNCPLVYPYYL